MAIKSINVFIYFLIANVVFISKSEALPYSSSFSVVASVNNTCSVSSNNFTGIYDPTSPVGIIGTSTVNLRCTFGTPFNIRANRGLHGPNVNNRQLSDGTNYLNYYFTRDAARTQNLGETDGVDTIDSSGTGFGQIFTTYGAIPAFQNVPPGTYTDTITISINF